jgi:hypothetical protein
MSESDAKALAVAEEDRQLLRLVHAMLGGISANFRGISLLCEGPNVRLFFLMERDEPRDREAIDDIVFEFEARQDGNVTVEVQAEASAEPPAVLGLPGRRAYGRRES